MYDYLKKLLSVAEQFGDVTEVHCQENGGLLGNRVTIYGQTAAGREFELELTVREKGEDA